MYNGIGLSSVRGSGTSGYVQANAFNRYKKGGNKPSNGDDDTRHGNRKQGPNEEVLAHNRKRQLELKVFEYRVELEDDDVPDDEIERRVEAYRAKLLREEADKERGNVAGSGTHEAAARKQHDMQKLQDAFGVGGYQEGAAFTKEYHEKKRQAREEERLARQRAREEEEARRRDEWEAREREKEQRATLGANDDDVDADEERRARERALDAELDQYRREQEGLKKRENEDEDEDDEEEGRHESEGNGGSERRAFAPEELEGDAGSEEAPRKRARYDTDSDDEESEMEEESDEAIQALTEDDTDKAGAQHEEPVAPTDAAPAPEQVREQDPEPDLKEASTQKVLEDVILALFAEKDILRKKEVVTAAEEAGVVFQDNEYSKLIRKHAISQPGGKWKKNG